MTTFAVFKSNNALLIQGAHTQPMFMDMLRLTVQRHAAYCNSHGFDFWCNFGNPCPDRVNGAWDKVYYIKQALELHYEYVVWLDSDTCILDFEADLRDALKDCEIGAACHDPAKSKYLADKNIKKHNNVGCIYFRNTPLVKEFVNEWWDAYPGEEGWFEQGTFNKMIASEKYKDIFAVIDDKYNSTVGVNPAEKPVVIGWHGTFPWAKRIAVMKEFMKNDFMRFKV